MLTIFSKEDKKREDKTVDWRQLAKDNTKGGWRRKAHSLEDLIVIIENTPTDDHADLIESFTTKRLCQLLKNAFSGEDVGVQVTNLFQATIGKQARCLIIETVIQATKNSHRLALLLKTIPEDLAEEQYLAMVQPIVNTLTGFDEKHIRASKSFQLFLTYNNILPVDIMFVIFTMLPPIRSPGFVKGENLSTLLKAVLVNVTVPRRQLALQLIACCNDNGQQCFFEGTFSPFWYQEISEKLISATRPVSYRAPCGISYVDRRIDLDDLHAVLGVCCSGAQKLILYRYCSPLDYNFFSSMKVSGCIDSSFNNLMNFLERYSHEVNNKIIHNIYRYPNGIYRFCKNIEKLCQVISYCGYDGRVDIVHSLVLHSNQLVKFLTNNNDFCQLLNAFDKKSQHDFLKMLIDENVRLKNIVNNQSDLDKVCQACKGNNKKLLKGLFPLAIKKRASPVEFFYNNIFSNSAKNSQFIHDIELAPLTAAPVIE